MKKFLFASVLCHLTSYFLIAQTNIISTNPLAEQIMLGNYNPSLYIASAVLNHPDTISKGINKRVSSDSLKKYLEVLSTFQNRNTGADTISQVTGIGAARRWIYSKFQEISAANENRLISSYLQFDQMICSFPQHRNIFAVLPGMDISDKRIIIVEGHIDSRCAVLCDTACAAHGMEDNGSGTALVIELARVMSKYSYSQTIVFIATIGEEQGLYGANTFATYCQQKNIKIKAVFNNDVIGGVICGNTSSPPSCSPAGNIDSTSVRIFSYGTFNSLYKQLARFSKLEYKEQLLPSVSVPMLISIMTPEDRTGRSGDHVPFRQKNFTSIRFTSTNEHGNANVTSPTYTDRQHTSGDILGVDTDSNNIIDSFFVDFNYLARNAVINGNAMGMAGIGLKTPDFTVVNAGGTNVLVTITQETQYLNYRVAVRTLTNDWDTLHAMIGMISDTIDVGATGNHIFSVCAVDTNGIESLFSKEIQLNVSGIYELDKEEKVALLQNKPNPFDIATTISVLVNEPVKHKSAHILIRDISGKEMKRLPITLTNGMNEVVYEHGYGFTGIYSYTLVIDGKPMQTKTMVFAN